MATLVLHIRITDDQAAERATRRPVVGLLSVEECHDLMNFHAALNRFSTEAADRLPMIRDGLEDGPRRS